MLKFLLVLAMFLSFTGEAVADEARVEALRMALTERYGNPCGGEHIWIRRGGHNPGSVGSARWSFKPDGTKTQCSVHFRYGRIPDDAFCTTGAHEWLHLAGYRPPPKYAFPKGQDEGPGGVAYHHSTNPDSLMFPTFSKIWRGCKGWSTQNWHLKR